MRAWESRPDCTVVDEPFYACYLQETGLDHPCRDAVLASQPTTRMAVEAQLLTPADTPFQYQKHMTHHMVRSVPRGWFDQVKHVFLLRHPARVISSFAKKYNRISEQDIGFKKQVELFLEITERGLKPIVVNSEDIRMKPEETLTKLCDRINLSFQKSMLSWSKGGHIKDGIWASHWYGSAHKSTGFSGPEDTLPNLKGRNANLAEASMPFYSSLLKFAI